MAEKNFTRLKSFLTKNHRYRKVEGTTDYMVWEVYDRKNDEFECWEVWKPRNGVFFMPRWEAFGVYGFYCLREEDITYWKRYLSGNL